jgi:nucleoside-diphosphate-sugar epimerase
MSATSRPFQRPSRAARCSTIWPARIGRRSAALLYHDVNVTGAAHACAVAETHGIGRIVFVSSVAVNGLAAGELDEDAPLRPGSEYGRTRQEAEQVFRGWAAPEQSLTIVPPTVAAKGEGTARNVVLCRARGPARRGLRLGNSA